ncbi:hypothetical protein MBRA1_000687 [Malassezia brasiliensis]|uniref:Haloacid dehalogenase-like hydrolase n=1 Tax=Malassezia brasiliensis TaxID=1821822 RepID=A0AAF0DRE2_9BASI|nr:hypothetical protein MBRA1_000687 [Malassezia brasiliensis]
MAPALLLVSDWDETITCCDTLRLVAPSHEELCKGTRPFQHYEDEYFKDQHAFKSQYGPLDTEAQLLAYVGDVARAEQTTLDKVVEGGLFKDTKHTDRRSRAHRVEFREGWNDVLEYARRHVPPGRIHVHIVSVNWSRRFILDALLIRDGKEPSMCLEEDLRAISFADIHANEIEQHAEHQRGTGRVVGPLPGAQPMLTGMDKRKVLEAIQAQYHPCPLTLYVGDSLHDLPCLLDADVGVLIGEHPSLLSKLEMAHRTTELLTLTQWTEALRTSAPQCPHGIVRAQTWHDVRAVIETLVATLDRLADLRDTPC